MKISHIGIDLIKKYEGFSSKPYKCPAGIPTIGYGATYYPNGSKVTLSDTPITEQQAQEYLKDMLVSYEKSVATFVTSTINQNQFDSLVSFAYNLGVGNLKSSTLLKKVNANPSDNTIAAEFVKWNKAGGKVLAGLTKRRKEEAELYCK